MRDTFRRRLHEALSADPRLMKQIAIDSGYHAGHIRKVVRGSRANPTLAFVEAMAWTLKREPSWLLGIDGVDR